VAEERPPVETTEGALESSRIVSGNAASDADRTCGHILSVSGSQASVGLPAASIDPSRRGETLSIADFVRLLERSGVWDPQTKRVIQPLESS